MNYWIKIWKQFCTHRLGMAALIVVGLFCLVGIYAPFLASSQPLVVRYEGEWYFPLFRYLFYTGFYTKGIDLFFNVLMFTFPVMVFALLCWRKWLLLFALLVQILGFTYVIIKPSKDPGASVELMKERENSLAQMRGNGGFPSWDFDLSTMNSYAKLNLILRYRQRKAQHDRLMHYVSQGSEAVFTHWLSEIEHEKERVQRLQQELETTSKDTPKYRKIEAALRYVQDRREWLQNKNQKIDWEVMPLFRPFHWEDDAGGEQSLNRMLPWWELTRINRKDLVAGLIFGVRISLVVGVIAVALALAIGIPLGSLAGFYGGRLDIVVCRLLEIWESMPTFFMLLLIVAITQSKSIFMVIAVVGFFGWTGFSRYIRGEFFKQRGLPYVEACRAMGFSDPHIIFSHILPNAIPPVLTMLPFAMMGAMTSEAGLSFLGLGEEGSCSWGVLMDEGRAAFPAESYLLWPPAILLTVLLIAIALAGDALRDSLDPKMHHI